MIGTSQCFDRILLCLIFWKYSFKSPIASGKVTHTFSDLSTLHHVIRHRSFDRMGRLAYNRVKSITHNVCVYGAGKYVYSSRDYTVRFAYVTSWRIEGKQMHVQ